jgi:23S rRNA-intervening sequence protein
MFNFEKLDVWQEAIQFADLVNELTGDFPDEERFWIEESDAACRCVHFIQSGRRKFTRIAD